MASADPDASLHAVDVVSPFYPIFSSSYAGCVERSKGDEYPIGDEKHSLYPKHNKSATSVPPSCDREKHVLPARLRVNDEIIQQQYRGKK